MPTIGNLLVSGTLIVSGNTTIAPGYFIRGQAYLTGSFTGSFIGDGSQLTGIITPSWNGVRNGNAEITGSLTVTNTTYLQGVNIGSTIHISTGSAASASIDIFHYEASNLSGVTSLMSFPIGSSAGYSGFKADYVLTTPTETEKKVGTLLGTWNRTGNANVTDNHATATGDAIVSDFSLDASSQTSASLFVDAVGGNFELNMLVTAFKRPV